MTVYTAIAGDRDLLKEQPESVRQGLQFEAFLDREQFSQTWKIRPVISVFSHPRLNAKYHKILSHINFPDSEFTLWIDGSVEICPGTSILGLVDQFLSDSDMAVFSHGKRNCIYQEAAVCIERFKDKPRIINEQISRYQQEGYPANNGLAECTILLRRNTRQIKEFNEFWWDEILNASIRDQISFPYVVWKLGLKVNYIPGAVYDGSLFLRRKHLKKRDAFKLQNPPDSGQSQMFKPPL